MGGEEYEVDNDDFWQSMVALPIGSATTLTDHAKPRKVLKRPIGFTADIDALYEEP